MTEQEWLSCNDPDPFQDLLMDIASDRKWRLFVCGCAHRLWDHLSDARSRHAVELSEEFADGLVTKTVLDEVERNARQAWYEIATNRIDSPAEHAAAGAFMSANTTGIFQRLGIVWRFAHAAADRLAEKAIQTAILRDIFGNPFRPITVDPRWRTETVVGLARGIYDERAFERMPILADALEEAGCESADVLRHCREPGEHVRGCWVVDLLLGKQ